MFKSQAWYQYLFDKGILSKEAFSNELDNEQNIIEEMKSKGIRPSVWKNAFLTFFGCPYLEDDLIPPPDTKNREMLDQEGYILIGDKRCYTYPAKNDMVSYYIERTYLENLWQYRALASLSDLRIDTVAEGDAFFRFHEKYESVADFIETLFCSAISRRATDIHLDISEDKFIIRLRVDGMLTPLWQLPMHLHTLAINRLKVSANMDLVEKRRPQDGHFKAWVNEVCYHFRLATLGLLHYEKMVIRILPQKERLWDMSTLGLRESQIETILQSTKKKQGLILITGPTNSGKSTLLYTLLRRHLQEEQSIFTIEDPVETQVASFFQVEVNKKAQVDFASGLRGILRQDPDIIAIGELRDSETLDIALKAALTGHLVYATLHTSSAIGAIPRLINMGADSEMLASVLRLVINQRLVRRSCKHEEDSFCPLCHGSGYYDRIGLFETWFLEDETKENISLGNISKEKLSRLITKEELYTLKEDAKAKVEKGVTTWEEVGQYL